MEYSFSMDFINGVLQPTEALAEAAARSSERPDRVWPAAVDLRAAGGTGAADVPDHPARWQRRGRGWLDGCRRQRK